MGKATFSAGLSLAVACALCGSSGWAAGRSAASRDVEGFATATCLSNQSNPYLKAQGDAWGSAVMQRGKGDVQAYTPVSAAVKTELKKGGMAVVHLDANPPRDEPAPVLYCGEIIDRPAVRKAIDRALVQLAPDYRGR